jgi:hypothetical protein
MEALTFETCQTGKPIEKEFDGKRVYIRVMNGLQAVCYQDELAAADLGNIESDPQKGIHYDALLIKHFIVDQDNQPLFGHLSVDEIIAQINSDFIYGLGSLVFNERVGPEPVEDAEKK